MPRRRDRRTAGTSRRPRGRLAWALCLAGAGASAQGTPEPPTLQTVVVTATRHAVALADAPAAVTVVDREAIEQRGADNLLEALRGEAGVTVFGRTIAGRKAMALRGLDPKHTLVLVDGRRISASDGVIGHTDFQLDWVPMEEVERIEVVRGPLAALYGAEALGGVVQVFTRLPGERFAADAALEGSWTDRDRGGEGWRAAARVAGPLTSAIGATLTLSQTRRQDVTSALDPRLSDLEGRRKQDLSWRMRFAAAPGHAIDLEQRLGREERWATSIERSGQRRVYRSDTDLDRSHAALTWTADWPGSAEWHSVVRAYQSRLAMSNVRSNGVAALRPNRLEDRVADAQLSGRPAAAHVLTAGAEIRDEGLDNAGLPGSSARAWHRSAYVQDEVDLRPGLTLTAGLRRDTHQRFGGQWSPRLYAVWRVAPQWVLKGGASHGFKPPTLKQITPGYQEDEGPYTYLSNPALRAETNDSIEAGFAWDALAAGVQAMVFENRVKNLIVPRQIAASGPRATFVFENIDRARLRGAEFSATWRIAGGLTLNASYQYLDARDGTGARLEKRPRHTAGLAAELHRGAWRASVRTDTTSGQMLATATPGQPLQPAPALTYVGASLVRELGDGLRLAAGVTNLGNVNPALRSPLYTWGEAPRTFRIALRGQW